jgi:hypothetical protein
VTLYESGGGIAAARLRRKNGRWRWWCVGGESSEVGDQELAGVCFGGGGVLLRRFPGSSLVAR